MVGINHVGCNPQGITIVMRLVLHLSPKTFYGIAEHLISPMETFRAIMIDSPLVDIPGLSL